MEPRQLLAADCADLLAESTLDAASSPVRVADAGSTRQSAHDVGLVVEDISLQGRVSFWDPQDVFRIQVDQAGTIDLGLSGMRRNADLLLTDDRGRVVAASQQAGRRSESISLSVEPGTYFIAVQTRSIWGTRYQLDLGFEVLVPESPALIESPNSETGTPTIDVLPDVPYFGGSRDWNVNAVAAPESWAAGYAGQGVTVAVVDTGVDLNHPDLVQSLYVNPGEIAGDGIDNDGNGYVDDVNGFDFVDGDASPDDGNGHGTHVAGTIAAANNGFGATGIAPEASIVPVRVLGDSGAGSSQSVAAGIRYAADLGVDIINLSLGGGYSRAIDLAIDYARSLGVFIVAAAGNEAASTPGFPARFSATDSNVISVGAHDQRNRVAGFSNDVGSSNSIQVDAPGVGVYSTYTGGRYGSLSGTSMAAPHVAGVAALALSANPNLAPDELRSLIVSGTIGLAGGSDAIGQVSAATTVAMAAASFRVESTAPSANLSSGVGNASSQRSLNRWFRTTSSPGEVLVALSLDKSSSASDLTSDDLDVASQGIVFEGPKVNGFLGVSDDADQPTIVADAAIAEWDALPDEDDGDPQPLLS
ncbi:MAG: S8 family peptidase [Planctomycetota bacterium]